MSVVVLLAVLTKSLRTTDLDKRMPLLKMSELLIAFLKPELFQQEQHGISPLLLAQTGNYDKLVKLMDHSSGASSQSSKKKKKRRSFKISSGQ